MRRIFFSISLLFIFIAFSTPLFAQASRYPDAARALAGDGFARRQKRYISRISRESMDANKLGFQAYQQKDYKVAIGQFDRAIELDKNNMFAHFNLACTLSLAYGASGSGDAQILGLIRTHLAAAADLDVHWAYKTFIDPDLDPVRGRLVKYNIYFPCPGDACLDQYYYLNANGTAEYATDYPDLSGIPNNNPDPSTQARGWYCVIGDCFLIFIPGRNAILAQSPADASMMEEGEARKDGLLMMTFSRNASGKIENVDRSF